MFSMLVNRACLFKTLLVSAFVFNISGCISFAFLFYFVFFVLSFSRNLVLVLFSELLFLIFCLFDTNFSCQERLA